METPIYDSTKKSFNNIENQIDSVNNAIDRKVNEAIQSGREWTKEEVEQLKRFFESQITSLKEMFENEQANQTSKLGALKQKIEPIKSLLESLQSPPSIDTIISWATAAAKLYAMQYEQTVGRAVDITKTMSYVATETPVVVGKIARLPQALDKLNSIPVK